MLNKVSNNVINLLKHFGYHYVDAKSFDKFISDDVPCEISGLVTADEVEHIKIDRQLLDNLEAAIDELNDYLIEEIDLEDINKRLK